MQFFVLGDLRTKDRNYDADASRMKPTDVGEGPKCPVCGRHVGMLQWLPPYHVEIIVHGRMPGDVVECSNNSRLVSDRFRLAWLAEGLRGIKEFSPLARLRVRPARLGRQPFTYFHIAPQRFGTRIDRAHSLIEFDRPITCDHCIDADADTVRGFAIDESSWTGEDLFMPWGRPSIVVTDRVRQLRDKYGLTNMNMTPVEEYLWDPLKRWTPYCYYFPDGYTPPEHVPDESTAAN